MTVYDFLEEPGDLFPYAVVRFNGKIICRPDFKKTRIPDETEIFLIPMVAGG